MKTIKATYRTSLFSALTILAINMLSTPSALANPVVDSREYKLMLNTNRFTYGNESAQVYQLSQALKNAIEPVISRNLYGAISLSKVRAVQFFDTPSTCLLKNNGYSFRERIDNNNSEVTLKFRSPDRFISAFENVSSATNQAETKLEEDIGGNVQVPFKSVYGHSTTAPNSRTINRLDDVYSHFRGFKNDYPFSRSLALMPVSGLTIKERVYKNLYIDLGSIDAQMSVTLWYTQGNITSQTRPTVAEVSFKYKDANGHYTQKVVNRSIQAFEAMKGLTGWINPNSMTKTAFVYKYNPNFCS